MNVETQLKSPLLHLLALGLLLGAGQPLPAQEERVELQEERDVYTKVFENPDGSWTWHQGLEPLHYQPRGRGEYLQIDPTLVQEGGWRNETNSFPVHLPEMLGEGTAIELGPELRLRWIPGSLFARTTSGLDLELAPPAPAWGNFSDEVANAVLYPDLYPGLDFLAEVRRGSLELKLLFRQWLFELAPEQIDFLYIEAEMVPDGRLMEAVERRAGRGEPLEEIPLYFGREGDEFVIGLFSTPGVSETQLEDHADALYKDEEGHYPPAPPGWRSQTADLLIDGRIRHFFRYPQDNVLHGTAPVGSTAAALTASFRFTSESSQEKRRMFSAIFDPALFLKNDPENSTSMTSRCRDAEGGPRCRLLWGYMAAGRGDGEFYRATIIFRSIKKLIQELQANPNLEVTDLHLGAETQYFRPPGMVGFSSDEIIAHSVVPYITTANGMPAMVVQTWPKVLALPYNQVDRSVPGGMIKTSTWSIWSGQSTVRTIDGKGFTFGRLSDTPAGSPVPQAIQDLRQLFNGGAAMGLILAMPYDLTPCTACTAHHPDPAVQALNGDYRVGAGFYDVRLEVTTRLSSTVHSAAVSATSAGGHDDRLYPGASREWDLELTSMSGGASAMVLLEQPWDAGHGVVFSFSDPATGAGLPNPTLSAVGDRVRLEARWQRADPSLYGKTKNYRLGGGFAGSSGFTAGLVEIPIQLKAPEGQPTFTQTGSSFNDNISSPMALADLLLPAQGLQGTAAATAVLDWVSGPVSKLSQGQHWDVWSHAFPGNDGEVVIYPDQLKPGTYEVDLTPCLYPDGLPAAMHCLKANQQRLTFDVQAAGPASYPPTLDFVTPWGVDAGTGLVTFSIRGLNLEGTDPNTRIRITNLLAQVAPQPGDTGTSVSARVNVVASKPCGPRELSVTTAGGTATSVINITEPPAGVSRNFLAVEAEAGYPSALTVQSPAGASNGKAVGRTTPGAAGRLALFFQVPATASYQLYARYSTPGQKAARAEIEVREVDPATGSQTTVRKFIHALAPTAAGQFGLAPIFDLGQAGPPSPFSLQAGKIYRLDLATVSGQDYPIFDLLAFSDGSLGPRLSEICF